MKKIILLFAISFFFSASLTAQVHWKLLSNGKIPTRSIDKNDNFIFVGTDQNGLIRTSNGGSTWESESEIFDNNTISALDVDGQSYYVGTGKGLYSSTNGGSSWNKELLTGGEQMVNSITTSGTKVFVGSTNGLLYRPDDETNWKKLGLFDVNLSYIKDVKLDGDTIFTCDISSGLFLSPDLGKTWNSLSCPGAKSFYCLTLSNSILYVGTDVGVFRWDGKSKTLSLISLKLDVQSLAGIANDIFCGTYSGVYHTSNNGASWELFDADSVVLSAYELKIKDCVLYAASYFGAYSVDISFLGSKEPATLSTSTVSPNPAKDHITIQNPAWGITYRIVNVFGETLAAGQANEGTSLEFDISTIPDGVYFVVGTDSTTLKFVKK